MNRAVHHWARLMTSSNLELAERSFQNFPQPSLKLHLCGNILSQFILEPEFASEAPKLLRSCFLSPLCGGCSSSLSQYIRVTRLQNNIAPRSFQLQTKSRRENSKHTTRRSRKMLSPVELANSFPLHFFKLLTFNIDHNLRTCSHNQTLQRAPNTPKFAPKFAPPHEGKESKGQPYRNKHTQICTPRWG